MCSIDGMYSDNDSLDSLCVHDVEPSQEQSDSISISISVRLLMVLALTNNH
jgi:hypothetical protein